MKSQAGFSLNTQRNFSGTGIIGFYGQADRFTMYLKLITSADIQMDRCKTVRQRNSVDRERAQEPRKVRRAAGAGQPRLPFRNDMLFARILFVRLRPDCQRVDIEIPGLVQTHAGKAGVIERLFHRVGVLPFSSPRSSLAAKKISATLAQVSA